MDADLDTTSGEKRCRTDDGSEQALAEDAPQDYLTALAGVLKDIMKVDHRRLDFEREVAAILPARIWDKLQQETEEAYARAKSEYTAMEETREKINSSRTVLVQAAELFPDLVAKLSSIRSDTFDIYVQCEDLILKKAAEVNMAKFRAHVVASANTILGRIEAGGADPLDVSAMADSLANDSLMRIELMEPYGHRCMFYWYKEFMNKVLCLK